jgi:uncharacterized RDD family membrane protein YckC
VNAMQASGSSVASAPKAGFWIRFFALFVDGLIIGIPAGIIIGILVAVVGKDATGVILVLYALYLIAVVAYFVYFWSQRDGQTIMNKALGIKVVKTDGSPITVGTGIVRYVGYLVDSIIFGLPIGYIWAAFDKDKQAWHDKIAGTYVIKTS